MEERISIEVRLFATLRKLFSPECRGVREINLPASSSIDNLLDEIGVADKATLILMVNGRRVKDFNLNLAEGDRVALFPPVGGG